MHEGVKLYLLYTPAIINVVLHNLVKIIIVYLKTTFKPKNELLIYIDSLRVQEQTVKIRELLTTLRSIRSNCIEKQIFIHKWPLVCSFYFY